MKDTKKEKAELLKGLLSGERSVSELTPLAFLQLAQIDEEPGAYYDRQGNRYGEEARQAIEQQQQGSVRWVEVRTYATKEDAAPFFTPKPESK